MMPDTDEAVSRLDGLIGLWRTTGEVYGEDGTTVVQTFTGTDSYQWLGQFFVIHQVDVVMGDQPVRTVEMIGPYDEQRDVYSTTVFDGSTGEVEHASAAADDEGVWSFRAGSGAARAQSTLRTVDAGQRMLGEWVRTEDDGASWRPWMRLSLTKV